jgi:dCMP deaminase
MKSQVLKDLGKTPTKKSLDKWQQAYIDTAERFAALSTATRLQVGAIVVKDNRIISIGYNGMPSGWDNDCEYPIEWDDLGNVTQTKTKPEVIHAEANAIAKLAASTESGKESEMYVTHAPCIECAKQIYTAGIRKVYYKEEYRNTAGIEFLRNCKVEVIQV